MKPLPAYGPRTADACAPALPFAADLSDACARVSRAADGRVFACALVNGHPSSWRHYGRDRRGPVALGYGYGPAPR